MAFIIYRHPEWLEQGRISHLRKAIEGRFDAYVGKQVYEEWARQLLIELGDNDELSFVPDEVGRAWSPEVEIDVLGVNWKQRSTVVGECKWRTEKMALEEFDALKKRGERLAPISGFKLQYALFSKAGFTKSLKEKADREADWRNCGL